jgi:carbon-monoxide dehydrogenase small subunit
LNLKITVNGENKQFDIEPNEMLIDVLRREGYKSVKKGCNMADCGTCTVLKDGKAVLSCKVFAASVEGCEITTVEALGQNGPLHDIQQVFVDESAFQCGFCAPGIIMNTMEFMDDIQQRENKVVPVSEIKNRLNGNLCRCTGYEAQLSALKKLVVKYGGEVEDE